MIRYNQTDKPIAVAIRGTRYQAEAWGAVEPEMTEEVAEIAARRGLPLAATSIAPGRRAAVRVAKLEQSEAEQHLTKANERIRLLEADTESAQRAATEAVAKLDKANKAAASAEQIAAAKEAKCQDLQRELDKSIEKAAEFKKRADDAAKLTSKDLADRIALLEGDVEQAQAQAREAIAKAASQEKTTAEAVAAKAHAEGKAKDLSAEVDSLVKQVAEWRQKAEAAAKDANKALAEEVESLRQANAELEKQLEEATAPQKTAKQRPKKS